MLYIIFTKRIVQVNFAHDTPIYIYCFDLRLSERAGVLNVDVRATEIKDFTPAVLRKLGKKERSEYSYLL